MQNAAPGIAVSPWGMVEAARDGTECVATARSVLDFRKHAASPPMKSHSAILANLGGLPMPYYRSGVCKCPKCGKHVFDGPSVAEDNTEITCRACKNVTTIKEAEAFGKANPTKK